MLTEQESSPDEASFQNKLPHVACFLCIRCLPKLQISTVGIVGC